MPTFLLLAESEPHSQIVFHPVDGRLVFLVCVVLIAACTVWFGQLLAEGIKKQKQD